jgi:hypothetical protein
MVPVDRNSSSPSADEGRPPAGLAHEESPSGNVPRLDAHQSFGAARGNLPAGTRKALNAVPACSLQASADFLLHLPVGWG